MRRLFGTKQHEPRATFAWLDWCRKVTDQVAFWPDHAAIRQELLAHLEDRAADLERAGFDRVQAEQRALTAMGNPAEVGKALNRAHKPWLGWLWQLSRGLVLAMAVLAVVLLFRSGFETLRDRTAGQLTCPEPPADARCVETALADIYATPRDLREEDGHIVAEIDIWVRMHDIRQDEPEGPHLYLEFRDDRGVLYGDHVRNPDGTWPETGYREVLAISGEGSSDSSWTDYHWFCRLHLEERPGWVDLTYPWGGNDWSLRVTWEE